MEGKSELGDELKPLYALVDADEART